MGFGTAFMADCVRECVLMAEVKEGSVHLGAYQMDYITFGKGEKNLIILPGLTMREFKGSGKMLASMYRLFSEEYRVYVFDKRNPLDENTDIRMLADDVADAMDILKIPSASLFGVSMGGMIAQYLCIYHPQKIEKAVFAVTTCKSDPAFEKLISRWCDLAARNAFGEIMQDYLMANYSAAKIKQYRYLMPVLTKMMKISDPSRFIAMARVCLTADCENELPLIQCPVLVLGGMQDHVVGTEGSYAIVRKLHCPFYMYPEYGHAAYEEAKDFNQRVYEFLKSPS